MHLLAFPFRLSNPYLLVKSTLILIEIKFYPNRTILLLSTLIGALLKQNLALYDISRLRLGFQVGDEDFEARLADRDVSDGFQISI